METYVWLIRDDSAESSAACDRCVELFNKAAGEAVVDKRQSTKPERPGYGVPIGAGPDGITEQNPGALAVEDVRKAVLGTGDPEDVTEAQGRLSPEELSELQGFLNQAQAEQDDWGQGPP